MARRRRPVLALAVAWWVLFGVVLGGVAGVRLGLVGMV